MLLIRLYNGYISSFCRQRSYHVESTGSRPIPEVKQRRARLVLGWETAWEHRVLLANVTFFLNIFFLSFFFLVSVRLPVDANNMILYIIYIYVCS